MSETNSGLKFSNEPVMLPLGRARAQLISIWLLWSACIFTLVLVQSISHKYDSGASIANALAPATPQAGSGAEEEGKDHTADLWKWLLPNLLPTLTMMVSAVAAGAFSAKEEVMVRRDFHRFAISLSVFYLTVLLGLILIQPIANPRSAADQIRSLQTSNIATGPIQGLVAAALSVLFATGKSLGNDRSAKTESANDEKIKGSGPGNPANEPPVEGAKS
jgi:hypothetical protein